MPVAFFFFSLFAFHNYVTERDINLSIPKWLVRMKEAERKPLLLILQQHMELPIPRCTGECSTNIHQEAALVLKNLQGKDLGLKWFTLSQRKPVSEKHPTFLRHLLASKRSRPLLWKSWRQKLLGLLNHFFCLLVCLFTKLIKRNHGLIAKT